MGAGSIAQFRAALLRRGFLPGNRHLVTIPVPRVLQGLGGEMAQVAQDLRFAVEATNIPGVSIATSEVRRYGYGNVEKKPTSTVFNDLTMSVQVDRRGLAWRFFQVWASGVVNFDASSSYTAASGLSAGQVVGEVAYKDDYAVDVGITLFDQDDRPAIDVVLRDAWPLFVGDVQSNWADTNSMQRLPVTWTFFDWYVNGGSSAAPANLLGSVTPSGVLEGLLSPLTRITNGII
jgi:hypothetical protein